MRLPKSISYLLVFLGLVAYVVILPFQVVDVGAQYAICRIKAQADTKKEMKDVELITPVMASVISAPEVYNIRQCMRAEGYVFHESDACTDYNFEKALKVRPLDSETCYKPYSWLNKVKGF
jgi:hypothetical protein